MSFGVKVFQGLGAAPNTIKNWGFGTLVFFYYERLLEVPASRCALALFIALCFDAVTDPLVGSISDNWRSRRLGRRHPFMYASILPLMATFYLLFIPPRGLGPTGLFVWLTVFAVLVRGFITLFVIPWSALAAELTPDYDERTVIMADRFLLGWVAGVTTGWLAFTFVFDPTPEFKNGLFNPHGYPVFALWATAAIGLSAFLSAWFTRNEVPFLPPPPMVRKPFSAGNV